MTVRCGVVFYDRRWHVGITDGRRLIDSRMRQGGVRLRELEPGYREIDWLPEHIGPAVWRRALERVGEPYGLCTTFVCQCLGSSCILPAGVRPALEAAKRAERADWLEPYRRKVRQYGA